MRFRHIESQTNLLPGRERRVAWHDHQNRRSACKLRFYDSLIPEMFDQPYLGRDLRAIIRYYLQGLRADTKHKPLCRVSHNFTRAELWT